MSRPFSRASAPERPSGIPVGRLLATAFGLLGVLLVASGVLSVFAVTLTARSVRDLVARVDPMGRANMELRVALSDASRGARGYLLTGEREFLEVYEHGVAGYPRARDDLRRLQRGDERPLVAAQDQLAEKWLALMSDIPASPPRGAAAQARVDEGRAVLEPLFAANTALYRLVTREQDRLRVRSERTLRATLGGLVLFGVSGLLLGAVTAVRATRRLTRPLQLLRGTLARLTAGERHARAVVTGPVEIAAVARSVNALADETERLRRAEEERQRLQGLARDIGIQIREHLSAEAVLDEAVAGLAGSLGADRVFVRLVTGDQLGPVDREWAAPGLPPLRDSPAGRQETAAAWLRDYYVRGQSHVTDGAPAGPDHELLGAAAAGSAVTVPFGAGAELLGAMTLLTGDAGRRWRPEEVEFAGWVAADLGRGLHQARLYEQEQHVVEQLRALDRTKTEFVSTISHELRTPLTSISGYLELLRDGDAGPLTADQDRMLDTVAHNTDRLRVLIEDLLTLSRIEAGAFKTVMRPVDVTALTDTAVTSMRPTLTEAGLDLVVDCEAGPLTVRGDSNQLDRMLANLLANAAKFTPPGGRVTVRATAEDDVVALSVADTGIGIPDREQAALFTRFFRASNAVEERIQGTGLGLTIVSTIVANHGGEVAVTSAEGRGTTVTVRLPRGVPPAPTDEGKREGTRVGERSGR